MFSRMPLWQAASISSRNFAIWPKDCARIRNAILSQTRTASFENVKEHFLY